MSEMDELMNEFGAARTLAMTGLSQTTFRYVYDKYCGPLTAIKRPLYLFVLLMYYKVYPVNRAWPEPMTRIGKHASWTLHAIRRWEEDLASRVDELNEVWNDRHAPTNALPHLFPASVVGCVDSFPIFCSRPTDSFYQSSTYNGKYGGNVLKVQAVCDHSGAFLWYSGPHLGTTHDLTLYRQHPPELDNGDQLLADLAYIGGREHAATLVTPFKKRMVRRLNRRNGKVKIRALPLPPNQALYNRVHSWYRATIEHAFGYVKRYRIINSTYRGRLHQHPEYLKRAVRIIMHLSNIHYASIRTGVTSLSLRATSLSNINFNALEVRAWSVARDTM